MGHLGNIRDHHLAGNVLSHRKRKIGREVLKFFAFQKITQGNHGVFFIRHLNPNCRFSGDRRLNPDIRCRQVQFNIIRKPYNLADFNPLLRLQFKPGNRRPLADIRDHHPDAKSLQGLLQPLGRFLKLPGRIAVFPFSLHQFADRWEKIFLWRRRLYGALNVCFGCSGPFLCRVFTFCRHHLSWRRFYGRLFFLPIHGKRVFRQTYGHITMYFPHIRHRCNPLILCFFKFFLFIRHNYFRKFIISGMDHDLIKLINAFLRFFVNIRCLFFKIRQVDLMDIIPDFFFPFTIHQGSINHHAGNLLVHA